MPRCRPRDTAPAGLAILRTQKPKNFIRVFIPNRRMRFSGRTGRSPMSISLAAIAPSSHRLTEDLHEETPRLPSVRHAFDRSSFGEIAIVPSTIGGGPGFGFLTDDVPPSSATG